MLTEISWVGEQLRDMITQYKEKINCKNHDDAEMILMLTSVSGCGREIFLRD